MISEKGLENRPDTVGDTQTFFCLSPLRGNSQFRDHTINTGHDVEWEILQIQYTSCTLHYGCKHEDPDVSECFQLSTHKMTQNK
jgi:hypothetical protein